MPSNYSSSRNQAMESSFVLRPNYMPYAMNYHPRAEVNQNVGRNVQDMKMIQTRDLGNWKTILMSIK